jgi:phenylacetate-CoA ligase
LKGGVQGRTDDITKVKGVLLSPTAIEEVVRSIPGLGDEFEVVVTKTGDIDNIALKVELTPGREEDADSIKLRLIDQLRLMTNLNYDLEFQSHGALPRYDVKAKRFKDLRPKE